jgi:hypothetical protein
MRLVKRNSKVSLTPYFSEKAAALENKSVHVPLPQRAAGENPSLAPIGIMCHIAEIPTYLTRLPRL